MSTDLKELLKDLISDSLKNCYKLSQDSPSIELEKPNDKNHGDISCNVALRLAKVLKRPPAEIANTICETIQNTVQSTDLKRTINKVEVKNPGFINFFLSPEILYQVLEKVCTEGDEYGRLKVGNRKKVQIEFVSANPTGPLSVAHARQAAVGDALASILNFIGYEAKKEYYVNDEGNQINLLGESVRIRAQEHFTKRPIPDALTDDHYKGEYIKDIAAQYIKDKKIKSEDGLKGKDSPIAQYAVDYLMKVIKKDLGDFNVSFDIWSHQSKIADQKAVEGILDYLGEKGFMYEKDKALWFKSTDFGDDKDRVVEKSDGTYTYLTPDIVYHRDKFNRGFDKAVNIWGPDHHGYIARIKAAVEALGRDRDDIQVLIVQLATIYRDGQPVSMSTRQGQFISLREVIEEVGTDAARFFFLMRHINVHLDFDLELAKKQTPENPVYYIQYAHARIHSIIKKANESKLKPKQKGFQLLKEAEELDLIKMINDFPNALLICERQMDPYALVSFLQELASCFHKFYDKYQVVGEDKDLSSERLGLINAARIVLANGLRLLGVKAPEAM